MAAQAIVGMVAIAASIGMGQSNYSEKKGASIGINAGCLVFVATKVAHGAFRAMGFSGAFGPADTARKTCAELSHDLVGSCRQGQSIRGSRHQWPRSFPCFLAGLQLDWSVR